MPSPTDSLVVARAVAASPDNWRPPGQPREVYARNITTVRSPWQAVPVTETKEN